MNSNVVVGIIAAGGWIVALLQYYLGYRERKDNREEMLLAQTLGYFKGTGQQRSIGIALVEGVWVPKKKKVDIIVPVLLNQAIYLLLSSDSLNAVHEERNLVRLIHLLVRCIPETSTPYEYYPEIQDAILRKYTSETNLGIPLPPATVKIWFKMLGGSEEQLELHST